MTLSLAAEKPNYLALNAMLNLFDENGRIQFDKDQEAARQYFLQDVNKRLRYFKEGLEEKIAYLWKNDYYEREFIEQYDWEFVKRLYKRIYGAKFRFATFVGAYKFYTGYALRSFDGEEYLETYEDRIAAVAMLLGAGNERQATQLADEMINQRYQPATPTFLNAGKKQRGELISCFLIEIQDDMHSIGRAVNSALQLSKRGGGVAFNLTNIRAAMDPIKGIKNASSGILPIMKLLEDSFSYANQLGARQGAGAVYLNAHHLDVEAFLDCKKEAADEKVRIKTLSLGIVIPDITLELATKNEEMYLFSPYDVSRKYGKPYSQVNLTKVYRELVDDPKIRKSAFPGGARGFFQHLAEVQFESGYPYVMFEDNVNRQSEIRGKVTMSNLCVTGETELLTADGVFTARELYERGGDLTVMVDGRTRGDFDEAERGVSEAAAIPMQLTARDAQIFKVRTREGFELRATEWHKMFVLRRDGTTRRPTYRVEKISLNELLPGDELLVQSGEGAFGGHHDPDLAYIAGALAGDGTFGSTRAGEGVARLLLYGDKVQLRDALTSATHRVLAAHHQGPLHHSTSLTPDFVGQEPMALTSRPLAEVLARHGLTRETKLSVPEFVQRGDRATQIAYLEGLLQTDGCVSGSEANKSCSVELGSVSRSLLGQVQQVLLNLGIYSRIYRVSESGTPALPDGRGGTRDYPRKAVYSLRVMDREARERLMAIIRMRTASRERFEALSAVLAETSRAPKHRFTATVESIEPDGIEDVYDTTVEGVHSLIFNGIVTGNCSEILQVSEASEIDENQDYVVVGKDISCNLGSMNISRAMDGPSLRNTVETAIRSLTEVSDTSDVAVVPSIQAGNERSHAVGLGQMNLHGYLARSGIDYASKAAVDFTDAYFRTVRYHAIWASTRIARERERTFDGFEHSKYATGEAFEKYLRPYQPATAKVRRLFEEAGHEWPTEEHWRRLAAHVRRHGMYHQNLLAVAPTGSISYVNHATSSIHPITAKIEMRSEGGMGRVYYPAAHMDDDNQHLYRDAYDIGYEALIDIYAAATPHVDQGLSLTLFLTSDMTTRDLNRAQIYAWKKGLKTIYYVRVRSEAIAGTDQEGCVSCAV